MRLSWLKIYIGNLAVLNEQFRDENGAIDFAALGREEYEFRRAVIIGDFSRSERAREIYELCEEEFVARSEAGKKNARKRWKKSSADGDTREGSQNVQRGGSANAVDPESATSADTETLDSLTDKDARPVDGRAAAKPSRTTPPQNSYGEFGNVKMTTAEFEKFVQAVGAERANALIEELSSYLASSGKRYKSHYATLLNWGRRKDKEAEKNADNAPKSFKQQDLDRQAKMVRDYYSNFTKVV